MMASTCSLDEYVDALESAWNQSDDVAVRTFFPRPEHPEFDVIVTELLCVDLERRWKKGERKQVEQYVVEFAELLTNPVRLEQLAFEEFRVRRELFEEISPAEYAQRFALSTTAWPQPCMTLSTWSRRGLEGSRRSESTTGHSRDELSSASLPRPGERFLDFEILHLIGRGRFGVVFLAKQPGLANRQVVLKITTDFWSEADRLAKLRHTNIVPIHSVHQQHGLQAVCMPYLGRQTLREWMHEHVDRSKHTTVILRLFAQIASGLHHAHQRGIMHRDVKPENILVTDDGLPVLLDFNLAEDQLAEHVSDVRAGGTLAYMSPEQFTSMLYERPIDCRSDVYSMGVVLYEVLTGKLPFEIPDGEPETMLAMALHHRPSPIPLAREHHRGVTPAIEAILRRCLEDDPTKRYQTALQLQEDLEAQLADRPLLHAPDRSVRERVVKWMRRHPRLSSGAPLATISVLVLLVLLGVMVARDRYVARLEAAGQLNDFRKRAEVVRAPLSIAWDEPAVRPGLRVEAEQLLVSFAGNDDDWQRHPSYGHLVSEDQRALDEAMVELLFFLANHTLRVARAAPSAQDAQQDLLENARRWNFAAMRSYPPREIPRALLRQRGEIAELSGVDGEAAHFRHLADAYREIPASRFDRYLEASSLMFGRDYLGAIALFETLQRQTPHDVPVWLMSGLSYCHVHDDLSAEACYSSACALLPESAAPFWLRGYYRLQRKEHAGAEHDFSEALRRDPADSTTWFNRAHSRLAQGKYQEALEDLNSAIDAGRNDCLAFLFRAQIKAELGDSVGAEQDRLAALERDAVDAQGWVHRSRARLPDDPLGALADLDRGMQYTNELGDLLRNRAHVLADHLSRYDDAIQTLNQLQQYEGPSTFVFYSRGSLYAKLGNRQAMQAEAEQLLRSDDSAESRFLVALIFARLKDREPQDVDVILRLLTEAFHRDLRYVAIAADDPELAWLRNHPQGERWFHAIEPLLEIPTPE